MMSMSLHRLAVCMGVLCLAACGCSTSQDKPDDDHADEARSDPPRVEAQSVGDTSTSTPSGTGSGLANPAAAKCVEDGYRLEYAEVDGVPTKGYCINDETGTKCESWAFFRGECSLDGTSSKKGGITPIGVEQRTPPLRRPQGASSPSRDLSGEQTPACLPCRRLPPTVVRRHALPQRLRCHDPNQPCAPRLPS